MSPIYTITGEVFEGHVTISEGLVFTVREFIRSGSGYAALDAALDDAKDASYQAGMEMGAKIAIVDLDLPSQLAKARRAGLEAAAKCCDAIVSDLAGYTEQVGARYAADAIRALETEAADGNTS